VNPAPMPPASDTLAAIIAGADIVVPNRTELAELTHRPIPETIDDVAACVATLSVSAHIVVTLGAEGAVVFPDGPTGEAIAVSAPQVDTVDSSGAGDAFCAALVAALNVGHTLVSATEYACEFAAWTTTLHGAQVTTPAPEALRVPSVTAEPAR
jgi:ribokinase